MSTGWTCGRRLISGGFFFFFCEVEVSRGPAEAAGGNLPKSAQGKCMTVTLSSGQLTVILAVGLTCWPYLFSVVCLIISGKEGLICVCKVELWPSEERNKGHSSSTVFLLRDSKYAEESSGSLLCVGGRKSCGIEREVSFITSNYSPISRSIYL